MEKLEKKENVKKVGIENNGNSQKNMDKNSKKISQNSKTFIKSNTTNLEGKKQKIESNGKSANKHIKQDTNMVKSAKNAAISSENMSESKNCNKNINAKANNNTNQVLRENDNEEIILEKKKKNSNELNKTNTILEQETRVFNFKKELEIKRKEDLKKEENSKKAVSNENKIVQEKTNKELIKEAERIVNSADLKSDNKENGKTSKKGKSKKGVVIVLVIILISLIVISISTVFGFINMKSNKIINGVKVSGVEVSNLTKEEAINKLENYFNDNETNFIIVKHNDYTKKIVLSDIGGKFDVKDAVNVAYKVGRDNNIVHNNYKTLYTMFSGTDVKITFSYSEELMQKVIDKISVELPDLATESSYVIDGNKLIIKNSKDGVQINKSDFNKNVIQCFSSNVKEFEIPVQKSEKKQIDIEKIHNEIYKKPVDAYYTTNPYKIYEEQDGLDFAITLDAAKKMLSENKQEYIIELKTLKPKVTVANLDSKAFPHVLGTFTTTYGTADVNRNANIALAAKSISSVVLMPGEEFSYNDLIGECSTRTGYRESTIYLNGELAKGVGGGICQVSTTLYNAVLRANLEIVQRRNHSLSVTYVPLGQDAMVSIGSQDFKFKNNRNYPIKVVATTAPGSITCQIQGLKQDTEYEVKLYSRVISKTDTKTKVETYKLLYLNGEEVSRTKISTDTYKNH